MFVYTREAHPGERVPHHDTFERKLEHARLLRDEGGIRRNILVDDISGTVHRAYGSMPNMTWVIGRGGRVVYKANWTNASNVESFLDRYLDAYAQVPRGTGRAPYVTEQLEFRPVDHRHFQERLLRNGPRAVQEFDNAKELWARGDTGGS
ncbi:hypothetical protein H0B56_02710 [Haloechinothrix sp. YIM 98757]|uniref:Uncharacterized protein n=1 Tax=Haloechinothrix aidingensis TaxID=2752311 RepID=A0A838A5W9_9PSEU|nr:hypothetical protein [Haloechinothrix aidingensis]